MFPIVTSPRPIVPQTLFKLVFVKLICQVKPVEMFVSADSQHDQALLYDKTVNGEQVRQYGYLSSLGYEKPFPDDLLQQQNTAVAITAPHYGRSSPTSRGEEAIKSSQGSSIVYSPQESLLGMYEHSEIHNHGEFDTSSSECFNSWSPTTAHISQQYDLGSMAYDITSNYDMNGNAFNFGTGPSNNQRPQL